MQNSTFIIGGVVILVAIGVGSGIYVYLRGKKKGSAQNKQLSKSLKSEQLKSDIILNAIEDGVVLVDENQVIQRLNPGGASMLGWDQKEAEGLDWRSVFKFVDDKGQPKDELVNIKTVFEQGKNIRNNNSRLQTKSGKTSTLAVSVSPLLREGDRITAAVAIFRDVSEERAEENQRAEFISTASHEMRTPVAAIEGYLSLALNNKVATIDARARDYLEKAHSSTKHLGQLFQDLLTSAKAEDGRLTNHPKVVEMGAFLEQLAQDLRFSAEKKGLFMEFLFGNNDVKDASKGSGAVDMNKVVRPLYYVQVDPDRIREVITNLFDNACKYTEEGKVSLGLTGNDGVVQIYVRDTGQGIPKEDMDHLFQKFYRVDNSATRTIGGTGLGLFICRKIIELYDGRIWVESEIGKGSTFYINIPRLATQQAEQLMAAESSNQIVSGSNAAPTTPEAQVSTTAPS